MSRRTSTEIEKDYKRIRRVVTTKFVTSIKDIAKETNLSEAEVRTSLSRHPRAEKSIIELLDKNKAKPNDNKKAKTEVKQGEQKTSKRAKPEDKHDFLGFVIDASICGIENLQDILSDILAKNEKVILTSITIKELEKLQKFNDIDAKDARHILAMAAENHESFYTVLINETLECPDDCIIKYCADHKDNVILLTSDKTMALKARMYDVETKYYKHNDESHYSTVQNRAEYPVDKSNTLLAARMIDNKLFIYERNTHYRSVLVISNDIEHTDEGEYELKIGDDVYIATKKPQYMTFAHYHITSLMPANNCKVICSRRIYSASEINSLPKAQYRTFMRDFKRRNDL